jgi:cold shock CspA family protein
VKIGGGEVIGPAIEQGTVETFDTESGLGVVITALGDWYPFHCTAIAGGSRRIDVGREVAFAVGPGGPGRWEAGSVVPLGVPTA